MVYGLSFTDHGRVYKECSSESIKILTYGILKLQPSSSELTGNIAINDSKPDLWLSDWFQKLLWNVINVIHVH